MKTPYDYFLPKELVANEPAEPRDSSRLFVYDTAKDQVHFSYFKNISKFLPENSLVVLNDTKVIPARVIMKKETGGKFEALFLVNEPSENGVQKAILDRGIEIGAKVSTGDFVFEIAGQDKNIFFLKPFFPAEKLSDFFERHGEPPLPHYIHSNLGKEEIKKKYQTVFADGRRGGSAAAPTAGLHFTSRVFESLAEKNIETAKITLHVGLGTFAPLTEENLKAKKLHREFFSISKETVEKISVAKSSGRKIVSVGTTTTRTLESAADEIFQDKEIKSSTDIFIIPTYDFKIVDHLITNFHIPNSSLMYLVDSFLKSKNSKRNILDLYKIAIAEKFRFYSFGDSMIIL